MPNTLVDRISGNFIQGTNVCCESNARYLKILLGNVNPALPELSVRCWYQIGWR